jgi:CHASE2 domain-containing sensor protein
LSRRLIVRHILLAGSTLLLMELAWQALSGALRQRPRAHTAGQKAETAVQLACGLLSWLTVLTCFRWRRWAEPVRTLWGLSLATAAGLSSLVWGPRMPVVAVLFTAVALLAARIITWALRTALTA